MASFEGKYYKIKYAICNPKPIQKPHPLIMVGGSGEKQKSVYKFSLVLLIALNIEPIESSGSQAANPVLPPFFVTLIISFVTTIIIN
ncbi:MAG TPA: hypothetical protein VFI70_07050 [Nitrososphaeraceae archaeon]|nr:hypothetical protein [Nitrososphaeraceae archaeon]